MWTLHGGGGYWQIISPVRGGEGREEGKGEVGRGEGNRGEGEEKGRGGEGKGTGGDIKTLKVTKQVDQTLPL